VERQGQAVTGLAVHVGARVAALAHASDVLVTITAIDDAAPATFSRRVIDTIIRGEIGFGGVLVSDDIAMGALDGTPGERTRRALDAGVDLVLHCNGVMAEMAEIVDAARPISPAAGERIARGEIRRLRPGEDFDRRAAELRFAELMAGTAGPAPAQIQSRK